MGDGRQVEILNGSPHVDRGGKIGRERPYAVHDEEIEAEAGHEPPDPRLDPRRHVLNVVVESVLARVIRQALERVLANLNNLWMVEGEFRDDKRPCTAPAAPGAQEDLVPQALEDPLAFVDLLRHAVCFPDAKMADPNPGHTPLLGSRLYVHARRLRALSGPNAYGERTRGGALPGSVDRRYRNRWYENSLHRKGGDSRGDREPSPISAAKFKMRRRGTCGVCSSDCW